LLPSPARTRPKSLVLAMALASLVLLAVILRLIPVIFIPSQVWADEVFQATEQAHRLVYGAGLVPWEFQLGVRSWLLPGAIAGLMELARLAGNGPDYYLPMVACAFALLAVVPVICCFLWASRLFGAASGLVAATVVATAPELVYFGARTLSEVVAAHLLIGAIYALEPGAPSNSRQRRFAGGVLLGLVCVIRVQLAPTLILVALWTSWRRPRERLFAMSAGALVILCAAGLLDTLTLGYPLASILALRAVQCRLWSKFDLWCRALVLLSCGRVRGLGSRIRTIAVSEPARRPAPASVAGSCRHHNRSTFRHPSQGIPVHLPRRRLSDGSCRDRARADRIDC
jgi:Alg9-like mannosyltransferase family